jgi:hypothetical protein
MNCILRARANPLGGAACALLIGVTLLLASAADHALAAPGRQSPDGVWTELPAEQPGAPGFQFLQPQARLGRYALDGAALDGILAGAPREFLPGARAAAPVLTLPLPDGTFARFRVFDSPILSDEMAARMPDVSTWSAQGVDDPTATARLDRTVAGFHAMIRGVAGTVFIDPAPSGPGEYISFDAAGRAQPAVPFICHVGEGEIRVGEETLPGAGLVGAAGLLGPPEVMRRTYRLAMVLTGEYTQFFGGTAPLAQAAMVTTVNRVNEIYENDVAAHFNITAALIYTDPATDPFPSPIDVTGAQITRVDSLLDADVGSGNYDIGHMMNAGGGGGLAGLGVVCGGSKGRGATSLSPPQGDNFDVDYVAHEMGHQMGGNHTFNGTTSNCGGGNRTASAAYEPGSGTTIMAYAGICGAENVQPHSDPYFHFKSLDEIYNTMMGTGCAVVAGTGNSFPTASAGPDRTVPRNTPFTLTGSGSDADNDALTYCWEEYDLGAATPPGDPATSPRFRSRPPTTSPSRTFPRLSDLFAGTVSPWEALPTVDRAMRFQCTVRDNHAGAGGIATDDMTVTVAGDPFMVTAPNGGESLKGGCTYTVQWQVGGGGIAANVDILLTTNDGATYTTLAANTPNDGSQVVNIPCGLNTSNARVRINAIGEVFFDISDGDFSITSTPPAIAVSGTDELVDGSCAAILTFTGTATDDCSIDEDDVDVTVTNPTANATYGTPVFLTNQVAGDQVSFTVQVPVTQITGCPATFHLTVTAADKCGATTVAAADAHVNDTQAPVATVNATGGDVDATCAYLLPFSGDVIDNCTVLPGDVSVTITNPTNNATLGVPTVNKTQVDDGHVHVEGTVLVSDLTSCPAVIDVRIDGQDGCGNPATDLVSVEVYDRIPPAITVTLNREYLWPPNHMLADIVADVQVTDNCPNPTFVLTSVASNEPENGLGDGDTAPDIVGADLGTPDTEFQLRSERAGPRTGRVYTIVYTASDHCGNSTAATVEVRVAHDQNGMAMAWLPTANGDQTANPAGAGRVTLVVPSIPKGALAGDSDPAGDMPLALHEAGGSTPDATLAFDATTIDARRSAIGNLAGTLAPDATLRLDATGDGAADLVLFFDALAFNDLVARSTLDSGPIGFHYVTRVGESYLVPDLFALPQPDGSAPGTVPGDGTLASAATTGRITPGVDNALPARTALLGARPTPFRSATSIAFDLARATTVRLEVWSLRGARVRTLSSAELPAGHHEIAWDGRDHAGRTLPPGIYWIRFTADGVQQTGKAVLTP